MSQEKEVKEAVRTRYAEIALRTESCCSEPSDRVRIAERAKAMGYLEEELRTVPEGALMGLGCGNPSALALLKTGETVLDLGAGEGLDVFLAAQKVGERGKVIGVDMTPEMVRKAREHATQGGFGNVEFRLGEIEHLPIADDSIDVIISNCVINLSPDKAATYKEAYRVLRPNGRILISDIVTDGVLPEDIRQSFEAWAGCVAGALGKRQYLATIKEEGFREVTIVGERAFKSQGMDQRLAGKILSVQVKAQK